MLEGSEVHGAHVAVVLCDVGVEFVEDELRGDGPAANALEEEVWDFAF